MANQQNESKTHRSRPRGEQWVVTRRDVLTSAGRAIAGLAVGGALADAADAGSTPVKPILRFGMVTDLHYADTPARGHRYYRQSLTKLAECIELMNREKVDFLIELGDFKDEANPKTEKSTLKYLETIEAEFKKFAGPRYHVLGNHDMDSISKAQFLARVENTAIAKQSKYYSFDCKGLHFVVLDANYTQHGVDYDHGKFRWPDANIPRDQLDWLARDLKDASGRVIVFVHQRLDGKGAVYVENAAEVRKVLQDSKRVLAVFHGHHHAGGYSWLERIHYYTLKAMVEGTGEKNSSYAIVDVYEDRRLVVSGYRKAVSREMDKA